MNKIMLKEMMKLSEKYNSAMNTDEAFDAYSKDLIKEYLLVVKKYPSEIFPLSALRSLTCRSRNQTEHIKLLNKIIEMNNDDMYKKSLVDCKKQPCNECTIWDDYKSSLSIKSGN